MSRLSAAGLALLFCAAAFGVLAVMLRVPASAGWRDWWAGAWAPREEFTPGGWRCAVAARVLTGLGLLVYVLGTRGMPHR